MGQDLGRHSGSRPSAHTVELGAEGQAAGPGKDGRHRVGGRLLALLVLPPMPRHRACAAEAGKLIRGWTSAHSMQMHACWYALQ